MNNTKKYCSYDKYSVIYDTETHKFSVFYQSKLIIADACVEGVFRNGKKITDMKDMHISEVKNSGVRYEDDAFLAVVYQEEGTEEAALTLRIFSGNQNVRIEAKTPGNDVVKITGIFVPAAQSMEDVFAVCLDREAKDLRAAYGAAVSTVDHALYDKKTDSAIVVGKPGQTRMSFDKQNGQYAFEVTVSPSGKWMNAEIEMKENVLAEKYNIQFSPINKHSTFSKPPVGWMTWYAVMFDASEEVILKNAEWQAKHLKDFGANTVWVDWEWYHPAFDGEGCEGINSFHPNPEKYPHGMKYLADKIKEHGLVPAIWVGYANEPSKNEYIEKYPDMILVEEVDWCGMYYYDFSNPHYLNEYLPAALENVHKWGYEAVKFDTLPISIMKHEKYHMNMYDPSLTTKEAFLNVMKKTRDVLGENMYMLSCSGQTNGAVLWASDIFDAARIGADIFTWKENLDNIERIMEFYPLHNIQLYADPDNVVLREEYNTYEQAKSRAVMTSLLGLPMTFGDEFSALDQDRIDLIKRSLPILDIHPMDLCNTAFNREDMLINLSVEKPYETYQVSGIFNMTEERVSRRLSLAEDLHLEDDTYLVYDFYRDIFIGEIKDDLSLDLLPYECRVISLRHASGVPQVISTSRHITQGAAEILDMQFTDNKLSLTSSLVTDDKYTVTVYVPEGYQMIEYCGFEKCVKDVRLLLLSLLPKETREYKLVIHFEKES